LLLHATAIWGVGFAPQETSKGENARNIDNSSVNGKDSLILFHNYVRDKLNGYRDLKIVHI